MSAIKHLVYVVNYSYSFFFVFFNKKNKIVQKIMFDKHFLFLFLKSISKIRKNFENNKFLFPFCKKKITLAYKKCYQMYFFKKISHVFV